MFIQLIFTKEKVSGTLWQCQEGGGDSGWITVGVKPLDIKMTLAENRWVFKGPVFTKLAQH